MVTGVAPGTTTITVKTVDGDFSASCTVNIVAAPTYQIYDFESGNLSGWTPTGSAFSNLDVSTASTYWGGSFNKQGTYHMWGFNDGGDVQTGDMRTTNFILGGDGKVLALISGGNDINNLSLGIYRAADNSLITAVSGVNDEAYVEKILDASAHIGTQCYLKAVDNATGGWGHLNLDNIRVPVQATTVPVTGVTLNKTTMALSVGTAETLVATVAPSNASNINVTWSSGNTAVATVSASGTVNAVSAGSAVITVTTLDGAKTASCTVTVAAPQVLTLDFESGNLSGWTVISGNAFSVLDVCTDVNWGWGGPFNQQGSWHLWGFKDGGDAQVGEIRTPVFTLGANGQVTALIGGGNDINNLYIALCRASDNLVIAKQTGANNEAYSSITLDGSAFAGIQCYVKVVDSSSGGFGHINIDNVRIPVVGTPVNSVSLNKTSTSINVGSSETLIATVLPANATNKNVTWTTSNPSVATVSASGTVTATGVGTAVITVTTQDGAKTASCNVTSAQQYLVLDFESGNLNGWSVFSGNAFSVLDVCTDSGWGWGGPFSQQGSWHLWGFKDGGDAQTGELRSQNFYLGGNGQVTAMIGGGSDLTNLYVALCRASDNFVIAKQTGNNNEAYSTKTLDGASYTGIQCYIRVFDNSTGGFGHLNVDNVRIPLQMAGSASMAGAFAIEDGSSMEGQVRLYPNPATDRIVIEGVSPDELISIVDLVGRVYASKKSDGSTTEIPLDRSKIVPGPYIVRITGGSHAKAAKLIIR
jgi:beta-fructofuranosidase